MSSRIDRRDFIKSAAAAAFASEALSAFRQEQNTSMQIVMSRYEWLNPPASVRNEADKMIVRTKPKTDFWRLTYYGYNNDNGHFYYIPVEGEFEFEARISGAYAAQYDQAGLMVRQNTANWMKCGTELVDGTRFASVVMTRDFSDWSTMPDLSKDAAVSWKAARMEDAVEVSCSLDGKKYQVVRQGYFPPNVPVNVGVMCASPVGEGFEAVFEGLKLTKKGK